MIRIFSVFLLSSVLLAQTPAPAKPADTSGPPAAKAAGASGPAAAKPANTSDPAAVRMTDPVMVIPGVCDHPPAAKSATAPCETRITRQQFETLWNTFTRQAARPGAQKPVVEEPAQARKAMATAYSSMAVMSQQATKEGLDRTPEFQLQLKVLKMQLLAKQLQQKIKNDAEPSPAEVEKYYKDNEPSYVELSVHRLQIPKRGPQPAAVEGKPAAEPVTIIPAEAEEYRKRAAAGEDFDKLQKEVVDKLQFKVTPPVTSGKKRHGEFPPEQEAQIFALPQGSVSPVLDEGSSYVIYKIDRKRTLSLDEVRGNIARTLAQQKAGDAEKKMEAAGTPQFPTAYFNDVPAKGASSSSDVPMKEPPPTP